MYGYRIIDKHNAVITESSYFLTDTDRDEDMLRHLLHYAEAGEPVAVEKYVEQWHPAGRVLNDMIRGNAGDDVLTTYYVRARHRTGVKIAEHVKRVTEFRERHNEPGAMFYYA